eukprot:g529.t1
MAQPALSKAADTVTSVPLSSPAVHLAPPAPAHNQPPLSAPHMTAAQKASVSRTRMAQPKYKAQAPAASRIPPRQYSSRRIQQEDDLDDNGGNGDGIASLCATTDQGWDQWQRSNESQGGRDASKTKRDEEYFRRCKQQQREAKQAEMAALTTEERERVEQQARLDGEHNRKKSNMLNKQMRSFKSRNSVKANLLNPRAGGGRGARGGRQPR